MYVANEQNRNKVEDEGFKKANREYVFILSFKQKQKSEIAISCVVTQYMRKRVLINSGFQIFVGDLPLWANFFFKFS